MRDERHLCEAISLRPNADLSVISEIGKRPIRRAIGSETHPPSSLRRLASAVEIFDDPAVRAVHLFTCSAGLASQPELREAVSA